MGNHPNISKDKFPKQGQYLNKRVRVAFNYNTDPDALVYGTIVRDDIEEPYLTIIELDGSDERYILDTECQWTPIL
jgi:hypothetical protein